MNPQPINVAQATYLIARREVLSQVRTKSFIISTAILLLIVLGAVVASGIMMGREPEAQPVGTLAETQEVVAGKELIDSIEYSSPEEAIAAVKAGEVPAVILPSDEKENDPLGFYVLTDESAPSDLMSQLAVSPRLEYLSVSETSPMVRYFVAYAFGLVFMMSAMSFGATIAQNTVVEKQTRIVELLLAAVPARALLAGKILGNSVLAIGQTAAIAAVAVIGLVLTGQDSLLSLLGAPIVWFVVFFIFGFLLIAAIFAGSGSLVSRIEDTGSVLTPVMMLVTFPFLMVAFFAEVDWVMLVGSYFPFSAPVAMPARLFLGTAQWWEPLLSLGILMATTWVAVLLGERIYRASLLQMGPRVKIRAALQQSKER